MLIHSSPRPGVIYQVHLWFLIILKILRAFGVLWFASGINDASKKSANIIRRLPTKLWNIEVQRFLEEVNARTVALTGKNIFKLTKKLILAVSVICS